MFLPIASAVLTEPKILPPWSGLASNELVLLVADDDPLSRRLQGATPAYAKADTLARPSREGCVMLPTEGMRVMEEVAFVPQSLLDRSPPAPRGRSAE